MAAAHGDAHRAAAVRALAAPSRRLLAFDGRGAGQATEVLGDLAHAEHIAVLVPGSDTSLDTYAPLPPGRRGPVRRPHATAPPPAPASPSSPGSATRPRPR